MKRHIVVLVSATALCALALPAAAASPRSLSVIEQGVVTSQDVPTQGGSEADTVVEPHVAVSPLDRTVAIAAAHDSRFSDGGAVGISVSRTADGGRTWNHRAVPGITQATGGPYERASDPVVAFGPDGTAYLSVLLINVSNCDSAVAVLRSGDEGRSWSAPSYVHRSSSCDYSDDKNWIVVDNSVTSPHEGRVYQFWTPFIYSGNAYVGSPQALRWSDDHGRSWSTTHYVTPMNHGTQNSQPMITADGTLVDTYYDYGGSNEAPDEDAGTDQAQDINAYGPIFSARSTDGGATWSGRHLVTRNGGGYATGVRCCLFAADIDPTTGRMYVAWLGGVADTDPVYTAFSADGRTWSSPVQVSRGDVSGVQRVNVDVVADAGTVYVGYGTRTRANRDGGVVQQQVSVSTNGGLTFGGPTSVGPRSVLKYAAQARGYFPGDYIGLALAPGRLYMVWARSSPPPASSTSPYHQVIWGATLQA